MRLKLEHCIEQMHLHFPFSSERGVSSRTTIDTNTAVISEVSVKITSAAMARAHKLTMSTSSL